MGSVDYEKTTAWNQYMKNHSLLVCLTLTEFDIKLFSLFCKLECFQKILYHLFAKLIPPSQITELH